MPTARMKAQISWMEMGIRHEAWEGMSFVALLMTEAMRPPRVVTHSKQETMEPLVETGR